ncbi:MAG: T9SS type A sorting domain-containing protein, partial [Candidatus Cloacimonetes bacterium]|nr:T9SS type A sorting domain-containing protein [Candidatus Cloacimonadota bacterium]
RPFIESGNFCVGLFELANASAIGFDESSSGFSYSNESGSWEVLAGSLMIRALVDEDAMETIDEQINLVDFKLGNYPNPFNPTTTIKFETKNSHELTQVVVFNVKGQKVKTLVNSKLNAGNHSVVWNGKDDNNSSVSSGIFFYKLNVDGKTVASNKMLLIK